LTVKEVREYEVAFQCSTCDLICDIISQYVLEVAMWVKLSINETENMIKKRMNFNLYGCLGSLES